MKVYKAGVKRLIIPAAKTGYDPLTTHNNFPSSTPPLLLLFPGKAPIRGSCCFKDLPDFQNMSGMPSYFQFNLILNGDAVQANVGNAGLEFTRFLNGVAVNGRQHKTAALVKTQGRPIVVGGDKP